MRSTILPTPCRSGAHETTPYLRSYSSTAASASPGVIPSVFTVIA
ncbi:MAG: hypothetical protein RXP91_04215 [Nitrososphaeria archaeon]